MHNKQYLKIRNVWKKIKLKVISIKLMGMICLERGSMQMLLFSIKKG